MIEGGALYPNVAEIFAAACHPTCFACREKTLGGLGLRFREAPDGSVTTEFDCDPRFQGYPDRLHGGIVALLLDTAMTHCLFAKGIRGVTARLMIRYDAPVEVGVGALIRAIPLERARHPRKLRAEIVQGGSVRAIGEAVFLSIDGPRWGDANQVPRGAQQESEKEESCKRAR